jgi:S-DNA-T family DNA segregation ATPase FtsK/SpoIIIE
MLFLRNGAPDIERFHGAFISEEDVETIVNDIKSQQIETETITFRDAIAENGDGDGGRGDYDDGERDELFAEAARLVVGIGDGSTSFLQRRLKIGFARAGRVMDELERAGIVGPQVKPGKPREVLMLPEDVEDIL